MVFSVIGFGFKAAFILILSVIIIGFTYEHISRPIAESNFPPQGEFVEVDGHKLHYVKKGEAGPTVVFESGLDPGGHLPWFKVQNEISKYATTVSYDRAGILWSDRGNNPKTGKAIVKELHSLLNEGGFNKPYILVGHSLAGLTLRSFISEYPEDISGIVFVDAGHPDQINRMSAELRSINQPPPIWLIKLANSIGIMRVFGKYTYSNTGKSDFISIQSNKLAFKGYSAVLEEQNNVYSLFDEAGQITSFGDIPLLVITSSSPVQHNQLPNEELRKELFNILNDLQNDLLNLSSNSEQIFASKSGHYIQLDQPEIVVAAIKEMISKTE